MIVFRRYVKLHYEPVYSLDEAVKLFDKESNKKDPHEFVEGLMFSLNEGVIMTGDMVDEYEEGKASLSTSFYHFNES